MDVSLPEFPERHRGRLQCWKDRSKRMQRARSIDSAFKWPWVPRGPEFQHDQLPYSAERDEHRTLAARKGPDGEIGFLARPSHTMSSDHLYESYLRKACYESSNRTSPQVSYINLAEPPSAAGMSEYTQEAEQLKDVLCKRCCMINVERLSEKEGYTHSMLDVLKESARSCRLCSTFFDSFSEWSSGWTLDRYKMTLSFKRERRDKNTNPDHSTGRSLWKCIEIEGLDTRPWQSPEGKRRRKMKSPWTKLEFDESQLQEGFILFGFSMMCYTEEGDPAMYAGMPWLRKNVEYTGSPGSLKIASGWLKQCLGDVDPGTKATHNINNQDTESLNDENNHNPKFFTRLPAERPTRLLEILPSDNLDHPHGHSVKLIETNDHDYIYAALSYCWGKIADTTWLTKKDTIQRHMQYVDLRVLPATIRDCLHTAAFLGIHHVWVDSLCIIQDSSLDWETESAKMGGIYRGAILTIAASKSTSSAEGCFNRNKRSPRLIPFSKYICVESRLRDGEISRLYFEKHTSSSYYTSEGRFGSEVYGSPLSRRAWAYQEQVLSPRMLYFAESQLYWECDHCRLSQDNSHQTQMRREYPVLTFNTPLSAREVEELWYGVAVETYSKRGLTNPSDKLIAISAVAKATYLNRHVSYVAGLWQDCILPGLCWHREGRGKKNTAYTGPSWSWASQQSGVTYSLIPYPPWQSQKDDSTVVKVLDVQVVPSEKNPFGHVHSGYIRLLTRVTTGTVMRDQFEPSYDASSIHTSQGSMRERDAQALVISEKSGRHVWQGFAVLDDEGHRGHKVVIAMINERVARYSNWVLLLLEQAGEEEHTYRRIGLGVVQGEYGYLTLKTRKLNFGRDWTEQVITIV